MARTYKRDARGRFAGGGGSGGGRRSSAAKLPSPTKRTTSGKVQRRGLLTQRSSLARSQAKLKAKDSADRSLTGQLSLRAQKAAVTRAKNKLAAAQKTGRVRLKARAGVVKVGGKKPGRAKPVPKLQFDAAANSRRLARATANIDKAFDRQDTRSINRIAGIRKTYMNVASWTRGDAVKARDLYRSQPKYSTISNPKPRPGSASKPKPAPTPKPKQKSKRNSAARPKVKATTKGRSLKPSEALLRRTEAMLRRGIETGNRAQQYLRDRGSMQAELGTRLSAADGRAGRVVWSNRNRLAYYANQRLNEARRAGRLQ